MRLKNVPGAREALEEDAYVYVETQLKKGEWGREVFGNENPIHIEIGSGKGRFINELALENPDINYLGLEKYSSVLVKALRKMKQERKENLRLIRMDATELTSCFAENEVSKIYLNFSDPWPKDRHAKRRLTSERFLSMYEIIMPPGSLLEFKTDNQDLFEYSVESIQGRGWEILGLTRDLYGDEAMLEGNIATEYELKFTKKGNKINKLVATPVTREHNK